MDALYPNTKTVDLYMKIKTASDMCRVAKLEKLFSEGFEKLQNNIALSYVGELNQNDIMY